jgi:two-component system NtrC family sensor kinase
MAIRRRKVLRRATLPKRAKPVHKTRSTASQPAEPKPRKLKASQRRTDKPKSGTAKLRNLLRAAEDRQAATADILKVIARSPADVQPVFEAIATSANRLIGGFSTAVYRFIDGVSHLVAFTPTNPAADEALKASHPRPVGNFPAFKLVSGGEAAQIADTELDAWPGLRDLGRLRGFGSVLFTPLMSNGILIGLFSATRKEPGQFASQHVQLLQTFADQAVIAIENVRLFNETRESLERQTERPKSSRSSPVRLQTCGQYSKPLQSNPNGCSTASRRPYIAWPMTWLT